MFCLGFIVGVVLGACVGMIVFCLCVANGRDRKDD